MLNSGRDLHAQCWEEGNHADSANSALEVTTQRAGEKHLTVTDRRFYTRPQWVTSHLELR